MAHVLIMPRQGNTVESCIIVEWKKKEGDAVDADTTVCEVETDKATFEVPAGSAGTILKIIHPEGDDVPVCPAGAPWVKAAFAPDATAAISSRVTLPPIPLPLAGIAPPERRASFAAAVSGGLCEAARNTSASIMRPSAPLPVSVLTSTTSFKAAARARGEIARCPPLVVCAAGACAAGVLGAGASAVL